MLTYVNRILIAQVIKLFQDAPDYRDDRMGTIETIVKTYYAAEFNDKNVIMVTKLVTDIDRAFRLIQQHLPEFRGREWLVRQRNSGEISDEEYQYRAAMEGEIKDVCRQLTMMFQ